MGNQHVQQHSAGFCSQGVRSCLLGEVFGCGELEGLIALVGEEDGREKIIAGSADGGSFLGGGQEERGEELCAELICQQTQNTQCDQLQGRIAYRGDMQ